MSWDFHAGNCLLTGWLGFKLQSLEELQYTLPHMAITVQFQDLKQ